MLECQTVARKHFNAETDEAELLCIACGSSFGRYVITLAPPGLIEPGPGIAEAPSTDWRTQVVAALDRQIECEVDVLDPATLIRMRAPEFVDQRLGVKGPRTGRRRFELVSGRDGLTAALFRCEGGKDRRRPCAPKPRTRILGPRELAKVLVHVKNGKVLI
jgi:hypothetical protein